MQGKRNKKKKSPLILIIIIILIIGIIVYLNSKNKKTSNYDGNSLIGTFFYEENKTKYVFNEDGTGSMSSDDYKYDYTYKIEGNILRIDFSKNEVHDVAYSFELNNGILKLTSKEGTVSINEQYILKKENK